jgi:hypothetical protein
MARKLGCCAGAAGWMLPSSPVAGFQEARKIPLSVPVPRRIQRGWEDVGSAKARRARGRAAMEARKWRRVWRRGMSY